MSLPPILNRALKAAYDGAKEIIHFSKRIDNVKVIRNNEVIICDYANINTLDESYKVTSNKSKKVKVLIDSTDE